MSDHEEKARKELSGVTEEKALRKLLNSDDEDDEDEDEEEEKKSEPEDEEKEEKEKEEKKEKKKKKTKDKKTKAKEAKDSKEAKDEKTTGEKEKAEGENTFFVYPAGIGRRSPFALSFPFVYCNFRVVMVWCKTMFKFPIFHHYHHENCDKKIRVVLKMSEV